MASSKKSPQEFAAQLIAAYPFYSDYCMPKKEAAALTWKAKQLKKEVEQLKPYQLPHKELAAKLRVIKQKALESGVWLSTKGEDSKERMSYAIQRNYKIGYSREEAKRLATKEALHNELDRFRRLSSAVLGFSDNLGQQPEINLDNFAKYILFQGTTAEKRALVACLNQTVYLKNKELTTQI